MPGEMTGKSEANVLVVIPCLNEEAHLPGLLGQLLADSGDAIIVVADGGSHDGSREIVERLATLHRNLHLMDNPRRLQSSGVNMAVQRFGANCNWLVRVDAHCIYPSHYVARLLSAAAAHNADSVVVPMVTRGEGCFQRAVAAAQNSILGTGGSPHRHVGEGRFVEHGHHALFAVSLFRAVGGYDENFSHNEDAELDQRLTSAGGRIWLEGPLSLVYFPRRAPLALARQYHGYGAGRAQTIARHRARLKIRQAAPLVIAPAVFVALLGCLLAFIAPLFLIFAIPASCWAATCLVFGILLSVRARSACVLASGVAAMIMHVAWSAGFWRSKLLAPRPGPPPEPWSVEPLGQVSGSPPAE